MTPSASLRTSLANGALAIGLLVGVTGCSQIQAMAPVGGDQVVAVRTAASEALLDAGVEILVAPSCRSETAAEIVCEGTTESGARIFVRARSAADVTGEPAGRLTVTAGERLIYDGDIAPILERESSVT